MNAGEPSPAIDAVLTTCAPSPCAAIAGMNTLQP